MRSKKTVYDFFHSFVFIALVTSEFFTIQNAFALEPLVKIHPFECNEILNPHVENLNKKTLIDALNLQIIAQEDAVDALASAVQRVRVGLNNPKKPLSVLMLVGPTRTGKTELFKEFIKHLGGKPEDLIVLAGNEMTEKGQTSRVIGAPPGMVGYGDPVPLQPKNMESKVVKLERADGTFIDVNFVLIDEGEKAHPDAWLLLMRAMDEGKLKLSDQSEPDFRNTFFIITSNVGQSEALEEIELARALHQGNTEDFDQTGRTHPELKQKIKEGTIKALEKRFPREVLTRLSGVIQYYHFNQFHLLQIFQKMIADVQNRILNRTVFSVGLKVSVESKKHLIETGTQFENGAGDLMKVISNQIENPIADMMAANEIESGDVVELGYEDQRLIWRRIAKGKTKHELVEFAKKEYPGYSMDTPKDAGKEENKESIKEEKVAEKTETIETRNSNGILIQELNNGSFHQELQSIYRKITMEPLGLIEKSQGGPDEAYSVKYAEIKMGSETEKCALRYSETKNSYRLMRVTQLPDERMMYGFGGLLSTILVTQQAGKLKLDFKL